MSGDRQVSRSRSFMWGALTWFLGAIIANFVPIPFISIIFAVLFYFFYVKKRGVHLGWFILGYFIILFVLAAIFGAAITAILLGGGMF